MKTKPTAKKESTEAITQAVMEVAKTAPVKKVVDNIHTSILQARLNLSQFVRTLEDILETGAAEGGVTIATSEQIRDEIGVEELGKIQLQIEAFKKATRT